MNELKLFSPGYSSTPVPDFFIDRFMTGANGEYIKIYLYLFKCSCKSADSLSLSLVADALETTETDVERALKYWEKQGLIKLSCSNDNSSLDSVMFLIPDIKEDSSKSDMPQPKKEKPNVISESGDSEDFKYLILSAEKYFGRTLRATDTDILLNLINEFNISYELLEYLLCYAVERDKKNMRYVEATALAWLNAGVTTLDDAKAYLKSNNDTVSQVMRAFGISGRSLGTQELDYIKKWSEEFNFTSDIITEACNKTIRAISTPSFAYTDKILTSWHQNSVEGLDDVEKLDQLHNASDKNNKSKVRKPGNSQKPSTAFHNFTQRDIDFEDLERRILTENLTNNKNQSEE